MHQAFSGICGAGLTAVHDTRDGLSRTGRAADENELVDDIRVDGYAAWGGAEGAEVGVCGCVEGVCVCVGLWGISDEQEAREVGGDWKRAGRTILCLDYVVEVCGWSWCGLRVRK